MEWISVDERMPKEYGDCLIFDDLGVGYATFVPSDNNFYWNTLDSNNPNQCYNVTHWMPLPEPPNELPQNRFSGCVPVIDMNKYLGLE